VQVVIGVRKIVKNGCLSPTKLGDGRKNKPHKIQSLLIDEKSEKISEKDPTAPPKTEESFLK
jgi:hypothetical protein